MINLLLQGAALRRGFIRERRDGLKVESSTVSLRRRPLRIVRPVVRAAALFALKRGDGDEQANERRISLGACVRGEQAQVVDSADEMGAVALYPDAARQNRANPAGIRRRR